MKHLIDFTLQLADTALIHSQRLSEWCGHGPALEIDIALSNIALDHIGAARSLYQYAATLLNDGSTEDSLAYLRKEREFKNIILAELPNKDFAFTIAKCICLDSFLYLYYEQLSTSKDETLAAIATKSLKEVTYHLRFSKEWLTRLGDGTPESKQRIQQAMDDVWTYSGEVFLQSDAEKEMAKQDTATDATAIQQNWLASISNSIDNATLSMPTETFMQKGGKQGIHTEHMGFILAELQYMQRAYPNMEW
jgi:ring-1,2-phenylacetyl-CoA epoxidase subunit PaaC